MERAEQANQALLTVRWRKITVNELAQSACNANLTCLVSSWIIKFLPEQRILTTPDDKQNIPPNLVDALLAYTIDPTQWESVVEELVAQDDVLQTLDPSAFLSALSKAEALAWQLSQTPKQSLPPQTGILALGADGSIVQVVADASAANDFTTVSSTADGKQTEFVSNASQQHVNAAIQDIRDGRAHALVTLEDAQNNARFGYLVSTTDMPAGFSVSNPTDKVAETADAEFVLLVPHAQPTDEARRVLQTSFNLTIAETAVCGRLAAGEQLKEVGRHLNISANTARNHLQSVFEKTGLNRQNDLLLLMTQLNILVSAIHDRSQTDTQTPPTPYSWPGHQFVIVGRESTPRRIAYRTYGEGRHTVVYFHESVSSSRLLAGTEALANTLDLRIICPERPGAGFSDAHPGFSFNSTAQDILDMLDDLEIERVSLLGYLSGGAHALAAAALLRDRAAQVMLVAARAPTQEQLGASHPLAVLRNKLAKQPWLLNTFFNILRSRSSHETNRSLLRRVYGNVPEDAAYLDANPGVLDHMAATALESLTVSAAGVIGEIACFSAPSQVDLQRITSPLTVWHGDSDAVADHQQLFEVLQGLRCDTRILEGWGSMILYAHWEEILQTIARETPGAT